jgi:hypothetical protein
VHHAGDVLHNILGAALGRAAIDGAIQRQFAVFHANGYVAGIDVVVMRQVLVPIFADVFVGTNVVGRSAATMALPLVSLAMVLLPAARGILVAKPACFVQLA